MNPHRLAKNEQMTRLALEVTNGVIVELGTYRGEGAIALCQGAKVPVYTIDDYAGQIGWNGQQYKAEDDRTLFNIYTSRFRDKPNLLIGEVREIARQWDKGLIELLIWDLGMTGRLTQDFAAWQDKVTGKFVIHDTDDQRLGSKELNPKGWRKYKDGVFWILERL